MQRRYLLTSVIRLWPSSHGADHLSTHLLVILCDCSDRGVQVESRMSLATSDAGSCVTVLKWHWWRTVHSGQQLGRHYSSCAFGALALHARLFKLLVELGEEPLQTLVYFSLNLVVDGVS